jgi:putative restriction endonuclease
LEIDPVIGCIILANPFFFKESDWIPVPTDWKTNIVQGKTYNTDDMVGNELWDQVQERLGREKMQLAMDGVAVPTGVAISERYGKEYLTQPRLGQGAFRVIVTEAYGRRCAMTGERTLPVLNASHIKPFAKEGPHEVRNGLLLREDLHTLFDRGYLTVTSDLHIEVSQRIKQDYGNGKEYYAMHGRKLLVLPENVMDRPSREFVEWHNENVFAS